MDISELQKDIEELQKFASEATRSRVKDFLTLQIRKLQTEVAKKEKESAGLAQNPQSAVKTAGSTSKTSAYTEIIKTYAWDQSEKFMKLYITLKDVQCVSQDNITCQFADQSVRLRVGGLDKTYELHITKLCEKIDPAGSYYKVKTDMVLLMLKKKETGKTWAWVTDREKKAKEAKKPPPMDEKEDPSAGIMKLLQNMYQDGDDEMKRTISKAMYESQTKQKSELDI